MLKYFSLSLSIALLAGCGTSNVLHVSGSAFSSSKDVKASIGDGETTVLVGTPTGETAKVTFQISYASASGGQSGESSAEVLFKRGTDGLEIINQGSGGMGIYWAKGSNGSLKGVYPIQKGDQQAFSEFVVIPTEKVRD